MNKLEDLLDNFWNTHKNNAGVAYVYTHKLSIAWALCLIMAIVLGFMYQGKAARKSRWAIRLSKSTVPTSLSAFPK